MGHPPTTRLQPTLAAARSAALTLTSLPSAPRAQDMTFAPEDTSLRTAVVLMESQGVRVRDRRRILQLIENAVTDYGGYSVIDDRSLKRQLGARQYRTMTRCSNPDCFLGEVRDAGLDRLILVELTRKGGILTVTMEINNVPDRYVMQFAVGATDDIKSEAFLDAPLATLLDLTPPPLIPPTPVANVTPVGPGDGEAKEDPEEDDGPLVIDPIWTYTALGAGATLVAVGGLFGLLADNTRTEIQEKPHNGDEVQELIDQGEAHRRNANIAFGLGVAALGTGALLWYLSDEREGRDPTGAALDPSPNDIQVNVGPTGVGVSIPY